MILISFSNVCNGMTEGWWIFARQVSVVAVDKVPVVSPFSL